MGGERFDTITKIFRCRHPARHPARPRQRGAGLALARLGGGGAAAQAAAGHLACVHVGKRCPCKGQCCSSVCRGPRGNKTCRAHHRGTCRRGQDSGTTGGEVLGSQSPACFCADFGDPTAGGRLACERDHECLEMGFPQGPACVTGGTATCCKGEGTTAACRPPCPPAL